MFYSTWDKYRVKIAKENNNNNNNNNTNSNNNSTKNKKTRLRITITKFAMIIFSKSNTYKLATYAKRKRFFWKKKISLYVRIASMPSGLVSPNS